MFKSQQMRLFGVMRSRPVRQVQSYIYLERPTSFSPTVIDRSANLPKDKALDPTQSR
jgi:hypothetical protein